MSNKSKKTKLIFTLVKLINYQSMPKDIKEALREIACDMEYNNDSYIVWDAALIESSNGEDPNVNKINDWLLANGTEANDTVLINYWW